MFPLMSIFGTTSVKQKHSCDSLLDTRNVYPSINLLFLLSTYANNVFPSISSFRQEYRLERRKAAEEAANAQCTQLSNEKASIFPDSSSAWSSSNIVDNCAANPSAGRHRISRVVVMHKNSFETFVDQVIFSAPSPDNNKATVSNSASDDFFDNDSFWSGQITWY
jgi:hypothetical protein